jgi:hypothetical protein
VPEQPSQESPPGPTGRGTGVVATARAHKVAATIIAVAGFLGLGGLFGQWAVDRIRDLIEPESPPAGFNELHTRWQDTADLSERLRATGIKATEDLEDGVLYLGTRLISPDLLDDGIILGVIRREAVALLGRIRATKTELTAPRADLRRLVALVADTTHRVRRGIQAAYERYRGDAISIATGDSTPIFSRELREDVEAQYDLVTQLASGLGPTARRFGRPIPKIRGWMRLVTHDPLSDQPL